MISIELLVSMVKINFKSLVFNLLFLNIHIITYIIIKYLVGTCKISGYKDRCNKYWRSLQVGQYGERGGSGKWSME